jgi:hypothetical protein
MTARLIGVVGVQQVGRRGLLRVLCVPLAKSSASIIKTRELMQGVRGRSVGRVRGDYLGKTRRQCKITFPAVSANIAKRLLIFRLGSSTKLILQITKKHAAKYGKLDVRFDGVWMQKEIVHYSGKRRRGPGRREETESSHS